MGFLSSKKVRAALVGAVVAVVGHYFPQFADAVGGIVQVIMAYIVGQGLADLGKEAKKIEGI